MYKLIRYTLFGLWSGFILLSLLIPSDYIKNNVNIFDFIPYFDKIIHGILFFGFSFLLIPIQINKYNNKKALIISFLISVLFALITEIFQFLSFEYTHREFELLDLASDIVGIILALITYLILRKLITKSRFTFIKKIFFN